jgi:uncharacterized protein (TIGR03083 family)
MITSSTNAADIPRIGHAEAMVLAATEFDRTLHLFRDLAPEDWARPTDCDRWNVRSVALHLLGSAEANASLRQQIHQMRGGSVLKAEVGSPYWWDGANELQIRERSHLADAEIAPAYAAVIPRALAARTRLPRPIRALPVLHLPAPVGRQPLGYLSDMGFTRDVWMHRVDMTRATGRPLELTADHDGRLVADIVAEWATTHPDPFDLELEGPAGGHFHAGDSGEHLSLDAVEFCRILSGRGTGPGVLSHPLPL